MRSFVIILVLLSLLLSSCQVYSNLYGTPLQNQTPVYVPESAIVVEGEPQVEMQSDEAKQIAEELQKKIDEKAAAQPTEEQPVEIQPIEEAESQETSSEESTETQTPIDSQAVIVEETKKVSLQPQAQDPDGDALVFAFTSPLNENGEWQTTYGDAGEYTATITASDGELTTTQDILIIVNKKEESPVLESASPEESVLSLEETESQSFAAEASDLNKDTLAYDWKLDGASVGEDSSFEYVTTYDDSGSHTIKVDVTDGVSTISRIWSVDVSNVNRKPTLSALESISAKETETITIAAEASDQDGDTLTYAISDAHFTQDNDLFTWNTDYDSAGSYTVTLSVSDGLDSVSRDVQITVSNVNRKPVIIGIVQK